MTIKAFGKTLNHKKVVAPIFPLIFYPENDKLFWANAARILCLPSEKLRSQQCAMCGENSGIVFHEIYCGLRLTEVRWNLCDCVCHLGPERNSEDSHLRKIYVCLSAYFMHMVYIPTHYALPHVRLNLLENLNNQKKKEKEHGIGINSQPRNELWHLGQQFCGGQTSLGLSELLWEAHSFFILGRSIFWSRGIPGLTRWHLMSLDRCRQQHYYSK